MYLEHFKLNELPFSLTPNTRFYCDLPTHQTTLSLLLDSLNQDEQILNIIGNKGTGKTMLCQLLIGALNDPFVTIYLPNTGSNNIDLLEVLAQELQLSMQNAHPEDQLFDIIARRFNEYHQEGKQTVIIIDEAHTLSNKNIEALLQLLNSETEEEKKHIHVVLSGQPVLDKTLKRHPIFNHCVYQLKPIRKSELNRYISHRLTQAGYTDNSLFSKNATMQVFRASKGLPKILNLLCHKALLVSFGRGINQVDRKSMRKAVIDSEKQLPKRLLSQGNVLLTLTTSICFSIIFVVYKRAGLI